MKSNCSTLSILTSRLSGICVLFCLKYEDIFIQWNTRHHFFSQHINSSQTEILYPWFINTLVLKFRNLLGFGRPTFMGFSFQIERPEYAGYLTRIAIRRFAEVPYCIAVRTIESWFWVNGETWNESKNNKLAWIKWPLS